MRPSLDKQDWAGVAIIAALVLSPLIVESRVYTFFLTTVLIWGIFALAFDVAFGLAGMMSFGHAAFFGLGAYTVAIVNQHTGWPFSLLLLCAMGVGLIHGTLVGLVGMRSGGVYFGLFTLGMAELLNVLFSTRLRPMTGGADGLTGLKQPQLSWTGLSADMAYYVMTALIFVVVLGAVARLRKSAFGRVLDAGRLNEVRAGQLGFNVRRMRVFAFALSAAGSALAGALLGTKMLYASPQLLHWGLSGDILLVAVIGGSGTLLGPVAGAVVVETLRHFLSEHTLHWNGLLGAVFIFVTLFMPKGLVGQYLAWRTRRRQSESRPCASMAVPVASDSQAVLAQRRSV